MSDSNTNTNTNTNPYQQLCVWEGTLLDEKDPEKVRELEDYFRKMGFRVKFLTTIKTLPGDGIPPGDQESPGGRSDVFFYIHEDDSLRFSVPRLMMGIRWWEDVLGNGHGRLYPKEFLDAHPTTW